MALSGSLNTNSYDGRYYTLSWTATQSAANNTSTIKWTLSCAGGSSWYAERTLNVVIDGVTVYTKSDRVERYAGTITSGTLTRSHNSDGTKSFTASVQAAVYTSSVNCTGSGTFTLNSIARASTITVPTFTLGTASSIAISKANSAFTHTLIYNFGEAQGTIATKTTDTSVPWSPPLDLAIYFPSSTSGWGAITCQTYSGNTLVGTTSKTFTANAPASMVPTLDTLSASIDNSANSTVAGWGICLQGVSKIKLTGTASGSYGSAVTSFKLSGAYSGTVTGTKLDYTGGVLTSSGAKTFTVQAVDTRGRTSASKSASVTVKAYSEPAISVFTAHRDTTDPTKIVIRANWTHSTVTNSAGTSVNNSTATLYYKLKSSSSWTAISTISVKNTDILLDGDFAETTSYDFRLSVQDTVGNSASKTAPVGTTSVFQHWGTEGKRFGVGEMVEDIPDGFEGIMKISDAWDFQAGGKSISKIPTFEAETLGNSVKPVYLQNGVLKACADLAGSNTYYGIYTVRTDERVANAWQWAVSSGYAAGTLPAGYYLINYSLTVQGQGSTLGMATCRAVDSYGNELVENARSRQSIPVMLGLTSTFNVSFIMEITEDTILRFYPQTYSNQALIVTHAFASVTRLTGTWTNAST